jgi:hypothetical protein
MQQNNTNHNSADKEFAALSRMTVHNLGVVFEGLAIAAQVV